MEGSKRCRDDCRNGDHGICRGLKGSVETVQRKKEKLKIGTCIAGRGISPLPAFHEKNETGGSRRERRKEKWQQM